MTPPSFLTFHNAHLEARNNGSFQITRYPREVRNKLNERGRRMGMDSCGAEIRFQTTAPTVRITLSCENANGDVQVYRGPFLQESHTLTQGVPTALEITAGDRLQEATDDILESGGFASGIWRILFSRGNFLYHDIESFGHEIRPTEPAETPQVNWLAYGSSITHSNIAGHPFHAARLLHWNLFAKGLSGGCQIEPEITDYFSDYINTENIDIITAELGVNMRARYSVEAFTERAAYFIKTLREAAPEVPLGIISIFTNSCHYSRDPNRLGAQHQAGYDQSLRKLVKEANDSNLHLMEGTELLPDFTLLFADVLHPCPSGQALMGHLLAARLGKLLPGKTVGPTFTP